SNERAASGRPFLLRSGVGGRLGVALVVGGAPREKLVPGPQIVLARFEVFARGVALGLRHPRLLVRDRGRVLVPPPADALKEAGHRQYATAPRPDSAACRCSSARYEERTSGPEKTEPKPSASPCSRNQRNSSGCTQRSICACLPDGWRYWPIVTTSTE